MRAFLNLRYSPDSRKKLFESGLKRLGYRVVHGLPDDPVRGDIFVTWNRVRAADDCAKLFQERGLPVLVTENAAWGNEFAGECWHSIARNYHNTARCFEPNGSNRWDSLGVELKPFRASGETVILPQRGIGSAPTRMPLRWPMKALRQHGGRVRPHPGRNKGIPLEHDLRNCGKVVTWGSGAAIKALMMGIPVHSDMPNWIGEQDNTEHGRLVMFRQLAWAQWRLSEIESGKAFAVLLDSLV